jgi:hypothetical protein
MAICMITNNPHETASSTSRSWRTCKRADPSRPKERGC